MGKYNYYIEKYRLSTGEYQANIKPKYFEHKSIILTKYSIESLNTSINDVVNKFDEIYKFNQEQQFRRNVFNNSKFSEIDWTVIEKEENILYTPFSTEYIKYHEVSGKPLEYILFENLNDSTDSEPSAPFKPTFFKKWRQKSYNEKNRKFQENHQRYLRLKDEEKKWLSKYPEIVKNIQDDYQSKKKYAIEIYFQLILDISMFTVPFKKKYILIYNEEDKSLIVNYSILEVKPILSVLRDKVYDEYKDNFDINENNYLKESRFNRFLNEATLKILSALFVSDNMNLISTIHFNKEVLDEGAKIQGYDMSLFITRNQFKEIFQSNKKIDVEKSIKELNRDLILVKKLIPNGIYLEEGNWRNRENNFYIFKENFLKELSIQEEGHISKNALEIICKFNRLEQLTINNQHLDTIPKEIFSMKLLKSITFKSNKIKEIPSEIKKLTQLRKINFSNNEIRYFSNSLTELNLLETLLIKNNNITNIPRSILNSLLSSQLKELYLEENPIFDNIKIKDDFNAERVIAKLISEMDKPKIEQQYNSRKWDKKLDDNRPLIITEGKTDWRHLKKALERFQKDDEYLDLNPNDFKDYIDIGVGESTLDSWLKSTAKSRQERIHIFIFDRDTVKYVQEYGKKDFIQVLDKDYLNRLKEKLEKNYGDKSAPKYQDIEKSLDNGLYREVDEEIKNILTGEEYKEWKKLSNNQVYALCIPEIKNSDSPRTLDKICIEFYYKEKDLKTTKDEKRLFFADEFKFNKENDGDDLKRFISKCGKFKTSSCQKKKGSTSELTLISTPVYSINDEQCENNLLLSKNDFTKYIENDVEGFDNFDIGNFRLIFDVIEKIILDF